MDPKLTVEEEALVEKHLRSEQVLREWGVWQPRRNARAALACYITVCAATLAGLAWYLVFTDPVRLYNGISGLFTVLALAVATVLLRGFQLRAQHGNCTRLLEELRGNLTGVPERDDAAQEEILSAADWGASRLDAAGYMLAAGMLAIALVNLAQGGFQDAARAMVYAGCLAVFAFGQVWHAFKTQDLLRSAVLRARLEASVRRRKRNGRAGS